ncbi:MAG TPA: outer membrane protein assembly factor BamA [Caulobacteraceae bacterium]|nr:outer membrane protein assembly factor BamA [Caulobacteraceae bacterium]
MPAPRVRCSALISTAVLVGAIVFHSTAFAQTSAAKSQPNAAPTPPAVAAAPAPAQPGAAAPAAAPAPVQTGVVQRIVVQGAERIEQSTILSYLPIAPGDTVDAQKIDDALKTLFRTDLFSDVQIQLQGTDLIVKVSENPIINQVVFEGNHNLKEDKLRDEVQVRPRGVFTRARAEADVQRIVELYRRSGRISATVTPEIVELPQKRVDLIFAINEGPKSGILNINIIGNKQFSDNALRDVIVTKESKWYRFFTDNDNYDPDRTDYDREQLRKFYRNRGYYDFHVLSAVAELSPDKNGFTVSYTIDEGQKYKFGKMTVETDLKRLNAAQLQRLLPIKEGQTYQDDQIEKATDALTFAAGAAGFAFVDVRPRYTANPQTHTVDVNFQIVEGPRVYVERIDIVGNTRTIDPVIRREMLLSEGDAYNRVLVDRSTIKIKALGFFKDVTIDQLPGSAPDKTVLQVKVTEQPTGELSFSLGYSSVEQLIADIGVSERNFRGRGQQLTLKVSAGYLEQGVTVGFTEPRFMGRNLAAGINLYSSRYDFSTYASYQSASTGASLTLGFPLTDYSHLVVSYSLHSDAINVDSSLCVPGYESVSAVLCEERGSTLTSQIGFQYRWDERDDPVKPTRGFYADFSQSFAGLGGNVFYAKTEMDAAIYHAFTPAFVAMFKAELGDIEPWNKDYVRINDRFFRGGDTFRGFQLAGIGARDVLYNDALGGDFYAQGTVELTVPNYLPEQYGINTAVFTQWGTLGALDKQAKIDPTTGLLDTNIADGLVLRGSAGISVFWKSPMGPLRFDLSDVIARAQYDKTQNFYFSTATRF